MTNSKKKKNFKLRRRVKRTIASITMVMAVVVAAIPVENYGTMQAADGRSIDVRFDMADIYAGDNVDGAESLYKSDTAYGKEKESDYVKENGDPENGTAMVQHISGNGNNFTIRDGYNVNLSKNDKTKGMVSGIGEESEVVINDEEYYGYVMLGNDTYVDDLKGLLKDTENAHTYEVTFEDAGDVTLNKGIYFLDTDLDANDELLTTVSEDGRLLDTISDVKKLSRTEYKGVEIDALGDITKGVDNAQGYVKYYPDKGSINTKDLIDNCEQDKLEDQQALIDDYNDSVDAVSDIYDKLAKNVENQKLVEVKGDLYAVLTQREVDTWNNFANAHEDAYNAAKVLSLRYNDLSASQYSAKLKAVYEYIIRHHYRNDSGDTLENFDLKEGFYKGETVYMPCLKEAYNNGSINQKIGANRLLATEQVTVVGIGSRTFHNEDSPQITSLKTSASVKFIGERAFEGCTALRSVTIDTDDGCEIVGDHAFENCANLNSISFGDATTTSRLKTLGVQAFKNTGASTVTIPASVNKVGTACFEESGSLATVNFGSGRTDNAEIHRYAFYNCPALATVNFADNRYEYQIGKGAFAVDKSTRNAAMEFTFPAGNQKIMYDDKNEDAYDYILAGRSNLKKVTFGSGINGTIPARTLAGCYNLAQAEFLGATATYETYKKTASGTPDYITDGSGNKSIRVLPTQLFSDVENQSFYVTGPATGTPSSVMAAPRIASWTGIVGYMIGNSDEYAPVPYHYTDATGEHIECGYNGGNYVASVDISESDVTLSDYRQNTQFEVSNKRIHVTIPEYVGVYKITRIGDNCFKGDVKNKIYEITISDDTVRSIGAGAFSECNNLEWVFIGNSVKTIGENAFSKCPALENVEFSQTAKEAYGDEEEYWRNDITIGTNAFQTGSEFLTFHGAAHSSYAPFELAMGATSADMTQGAHICYKTDEPMNLTIIRNNENNLATLVDYPHYDEIDTINKEYLRKKYNSADYSIKETFEDFYINNTLDTIPDDELRIVEAVLNINLPSGIQSVDSASFYNGKNDKDFAYVKNQYIFKESNIDQTTNYSKYRIYDKTQIKTNIRDDGKNITKIYSEDGYIGDSEYASVYGDDPKVAVGGLFSGYFDDNNQKVSSRMVQQYALSGNGQGLIDHTYDGHDYVEEYDSGNDYLTSVSMPTVTALPDYAFDSCENLLTASFSGSLAEINKLPFRNCKSLYDVDLGNNTNYAFRDLILYAANGDGRTYTVKECLEGRGNGNDYLSQVVGVMDGVTAIEEKAFSNCNAVGEVDLSNSTITEVPVDCFKNCTSLRKVTLPTTIRQINTGSFINTDNVDVTIPNGNCVITAGAIDGKHVFRIIGPQYLEDGVTLSDLYHSYLTLVADYGNNNVIFADLGNQFTVEFVDRDLNTIPGYKLDVDKNASLEASQIPAGPEIDGYDFVGWMCRVGDNVLRGTKVGDAAFVNITENRLYYPSYEANPKKVVSDGNTYGFEFENATATLVSGSDTVAAGTQLTSGQQLEGGATVSLIASDQTRFQYWSAAGTAANDTSNYNDMFGGNTNNYIITFTMPNAAVRVTAHLNTSGGNQGGSSGGNQGGSSGDGNQGGSSGGNQGGSTGDTTTKYKVTVNYGSGSGEYAAGATVNISAYAPDSPSRVFSKWTTSNSGLGFANASSATTSFVMPAADVTVTANYKTRTSGDDDDDSTPSRRPGTNTTTTTVTNRPSSSTSTTGTTGTVNNTTGTTGTTTGTNNDGNRIYITKNGVSNKDVASISVDGSTDNFIVRITESAEATAAVEQALTNRYGSLDGLAYFPMDISLYDSTGQNKITDTYGLNITVTMPIPDVLIQYGGNARVAAADNGNLQQLTPRFTTIDGIACISFVPPHFSPYVIYVDTNNLVAGQTLDATPSTGDPIHPKWFAAIGMACVSILLFVTSDGRKRKNFKAA